MVRVRKESEGVIWPVLKLELCLGRDWVTPVITVGIYDGIHFGHESTSLQVKEQ